MEQAKRPFSATDQSSTVLLVEDHVGYRNVVRDALCWYLSELDVLTAGSVGEALNIMRSQDVDVVVADVTLPDGSAVDLVTAPRDRACHKHRFILFSNHSCAEMLPILRLPNVDGYISKEEGVKMLAARILRVLDEAAIPQETTPEAGHSKRVGPC
ncbi:MAG: response regulator [Prosthecobacter sp.]